MKILPVGAVLFRADRRTDGRTDMTKLIVTFPRFAKARKKDDDWDIRKTAMKRGRRKLRAPKSRTTGHSVICVLPLLNHTNDFDKIPYEHHASGGGGGTPKQYLSKFPT